ncbi:KANK4 protein, partial [Origma solitaria]|nr:KANK4 protein [Origma solitaria]
WGVVSADGQPPKPDGEREQPRSLPYSLETPYGFHLDLDFLKYVDDIEKGNTIRRLGWPHDALRARPQLLRASSMPDALPPGLSPPGGPSPLRTYPQHCHDRGGSESAVCPGSDGAALPPPREMGLEQDGLSRHPGGVVPGLGPGQPPWQSQQLQVLVESDGGGEEGDAAGASGGPDVAGGEAAAPAVLQLTEESVSPAERGLSASEMELNGLKEGEESNTRAGRDEEGSVPQAPVTGQPGGIAVLKQQIAELQEQLGKKKEELERVRAVLEQQDQEIKEKERSIKLLASSKAQLEEQLCQEKSKAEWGGGALQCLDAAVNTDLDLSQLTGLRQAHDKGVNVNIPLSTRSVGCGAHGADNGNAQAVGLCAWREQGRADTRAEGHFGEASMEAGLPAPCFTQLQIHEHASDDNQNHRNSCGSLGPKAAESEAGFGEDEPGEGLEEEGAPGHKDLPAVDPIGQYVKKIQELLQEQWLCLEHGYPELASAIKQPASKLSSIQNQLVNSLNSLLSAYSSQGPVDKENSNTHYQQLENSPTTSLKSIMKKKGYGFHAGGNGTKKNLQFVGVNGGYETTSSEDTSCDDSDTETEGRASDGEPGQAGCESQEVSSGEKCEDEDEDDDDDGQEACKPSEEFLAVCQLLSEHLPEIRSTSDKHLRHALGSMSQEWFQVSSHKSSRPEVVAAYLQALGDTQPQLLETLVNLPDRNGNTALHYSVSHSNFAVAKLLLDTGVCCLDLQNRAGYTAVMLTLLAAPETRQDMEVVMRLLREGDVNLRAAQ